MNASPVFFAHGMGYDPVAPVWPPLNDGDIADLASAFSQLEGGGKIEWISPRPFSSAALVRSRYGHVFVKRHALPIRSAVDLYEEHQFMKHLAARGFPVSEVLPSRGGATAVEKNGWTYELHAVPPGLDLYREALSWSPFFHQNHARSAGRSLADLHRAAADFLAPARRARVLVSRFQAFATPDPIPMLEAYLSERPRLAEYLDTRPWREDTVRVLMPFHERLRPLLPSLVRTWGHHDWHASNLFWSAPGKQGKVTAVLDFGLANRSSAMFDLATAIERNVIAWLEWQAGRPAQVHWTDLEELLNGYEDRRPLGSGDWANLTALLPLVHAEFALSEIDYFFGILHHRDYADLAYQGYYLGHAEWFKTSAGQALLGKLEERGTRPPKGYQ